LLFALPGQGSVASGTVELTDIRGQVLHTISIPLVQIFSPPRWEKNSVRMELVFDWQLE